MSTEIAEPPPATEVVQTPPSIASLINLKVKGSDGAEVQTNRTALFDPPKTPEKAPEKPVVAPVVEKAPEVAKPEIKVPTDAEKNFAALREKAEAAEKKLADIQAERDRIVQEYEGFKKNPIPKEIEDRISAAEKRALEYQTALRTADLARDPEFQAEYAGKIEGNLKTMIDLAVASGLDKSEANSMISQWNEDRMGEVAESLSPAQKMRFQASWLEAVRLDQERNQKIQNSEATWQQLQKQREEQNQKQQSAYLNSLQQDRLRVIEKLGENEFWKSDETVRKETEAMLDRVIGINGDKMPAADVLQIMGHTHVMAHQFKKTMAEKDAMAAELETARAKIAEQDAFIKSQSQSPMAPSPTRTDAAPPDKAILASLLHPVIRP